MTPAPETIGLLGVAVLFVLLALRIPVAYTLGGVGLLGLWLVAGPAPALGVAGKIPFTKVASYSLAVVPLFILTGCFAYHAGFAAQVFDAARAWLGRFRGGVAMATVLGAAAFGAASGSGLASTATLARVTIPEMIRAGVAPRLAYGVVGAAGPLAQMIPPSILMLVYAILADQSVSKLLIAGVVPGLMMAAIYLVVIAIQVRLNPRLAPAVSSPPLRQRVLALRGVWGIGVLAALILGGLYTGFFTPTEAGAVGAAWALLLAASVRKLDRKTLGESLSETVRTTAMLFLIVVGAFIFSQFLAIARIPTMLSEWITGLALPPMMVIVSVVLLYLFLGLFIDMLAAMFLTLPILLPPIFALGFDPIWFGVLMVLLCEIALVTPPFGLGLFIIQGATGERDLKEIIVGVVPFVIGDLAMIAILLAFPQVALFLPSRM